MRSTMRSTACLSRSVSDASNTSQSAHATCWPQSRASTTAPPKAPALLPSSTAFPADCASRKLAARAAHTPASQHEASSNSAELQGSNKSSTSGRALHSDTVAHACTVEACASDATCADVVGALSPRLQDSMHSDMEEAAKSPRQCNGTDQASTAAPRLAGNGSVQRRKKKKAAPVRVNLDGCKYDACVPWPELAC